MKQLSASATVRVPADERIDVDRIGKAYVVK
jgi:hypothetical protein